MSYRHNGGPAIDVPEGFDKLGWVAIHRAIRDHWLVGYGKPVAPADPSRGAHSQHEAFGDLIMECRYQAGYVTNGGRKMRIEPGQLLGGIAWLANRWNWTSKKVRWFLDKLEEDGMISRSTADQKGLPHGAFKGNQKMMITLCNYGAYQFSDKQFLTPQATDDASEAVEVTDNSSSCDSNKGNRGATKRATKRATILISIIKITHLRARIRARERRLAWKIKNRRPRSSRTGGSTAKPSNSIPRSTPTGEHSSRHSKERGQPPSCRRIISSP